MGSYWVRIGFGFSKRPILLNKVGFVWQKSTFYGNQESGVKIQVRVTGTEGAKGNKVRDVDTPSFPHGAMVLGLALDRAAHGLTIAQEKIKKTGRTRFRQVF